jgi:hypothetical protein
MDLFEKLKYHNWARRGDTSPADSDEGEPKMKTALRIFAVAIVVAGAAAASFSSPKHVVANHLAASASMPTPSCAYCR